MSFNILQQRIRQHEYLRDLRTRLLHLHVCLIEIERINYEHVRGKISNGELFHLAIEHEQFAWIREISKRIIKIDRMLCADKPISISDLQNLVGDIRTRLVPVELGHGFARKYYNALQHNPGVALAHVNLAKVLAASSNI